MPAWELISCAFGGHVRVGTDAAQVRAEDRLVALPGPSSEPPTRWYRCLRCDSWSLEAVPDQAQRPFPPDRDDIVVPVRGRPLRDRYVLRLIAIDRLVHVLVLTALAVALFVVAGDQIALRADFDRIVSALQGGGGAPVSRSGVLGSLHSLFRVTPAHLRTLGAVVVAYAALEAVEMVGLWRARRWAEYLTFVATTVLVPFEVYELTKSLSGLKIGTLVLNVIIVVYLLLAKRLFGIRGGSAAERDERDAETGWRALEAASPWLVPERRAPDQTAASGVRRSGS